MKITKQQLKQIIKEELEAALSEKRHIRDVDGEYMERAPVALEDFEVWLEENPEYGHPGDWDYVRAYAPAWAPDEEAAWWVKEK